MQFACFTTGQLELLFSSRFHPEKFVRFARNPSTGVIEPDFESLEACQAEDRRRACALRALVQPEPKQRRPNRAAESPPLPGDPLALAAMLDTIGNASPNQPIPSCLASAVYMRYRRIGVLGAIVELLASNRGLDAAWVSGSSTPFRFDHNNGWPEAGQLARQHLEHKLRALGAFNAPGFLIGFFHGCYVPELERFQLRYRGVVAGAKLSCVCKPDPTPLNAKTTVGHARFRLHPIRDPRQHISGLLPNFLPEVQRSPEVKSVAISRMREPVHSLYLSWLAQHRLAGLTAISGAFYWNGRLRMNECQQTFGDAAAHRSVTRSRSQKHQLEPMASRALPGI